MIETSPRPESWLQHLRAHPNPVWLRELRQATRLQRTPIILAVVSGMMTILICSIGGVAATTAEPAKVGAITFQIFFSLAFAVVTWIAPAVAANTIAGERSGRTWEALRLSALSPRAIARGKFLAAFTYISLYIVMLVPVGALPFLFGGVTATEVLLAFVILVFFAAIAVAFGLSVSAQFSSPSAAIIVTLLVALPLSMLVYGFAGVGLSLAAHDLWPSVAGGPPVWLPSAYVRADFGLAYFVFLLVLPVVLTVLPCWLFYEVTVANMASPSDDRSTRLRIWFLVAMPVFSGSVALVTLAARSIKWDYTGSTLIWAFGCFGAFLFMGEPLEPSERVLSHWQRQQTSNFMRSLGPGVLRASALLGLLTLLGLAVNGAVAMITAKSPADRDALLAFHGYGAAFFGFVVGFSAWARGRAQSAGIPRLLLIVALFFAFVGPWIIMAMAGVMTGAHDRSMLMAGPSPTFAVVMAQALSDGTPGSELVALTGSACAAAWALLGAGLLATANLRVKKRIQAAREARQVLLRTFEQDDADEASDTGNAVRTEPSATAG